MKQCRWSLLVITSVAVAAVLAGPAAASGVTDAVAVAYLNAQRAANELPADVAVSPELSKGCFNHNEYIRIHGMKHLEQPGEEGYTPEGAGEGPYGGSEVLSPSSDWETTYNPWGNAPIHLYLMFRPEVVLSGYDDHVVACMRMRSGRPEPDSPAFYAYTSSAGRSGVPYEQTAREWPYVPQELVGIPEGETTGPNLLLFSQGFGSDLQAEEASLSGSGGQVPIRMVVESTQNAIGSGSWFRGGGVMIPVNPLQPFSTYTARILWRNSDGDNLAQTFSFETRGRTPYLSVAAHDNRRGGLAIKADSEAPTIVIEARGPGGRVERPTLRRGKATIPSAPGSWTVCASTGGRETAYQPEQACDSTTIKGQPTLRLATKAKRRRVRLDVGAPAIGRPATLSVRQFRRSCGHRFPGAPRVCRLALRREPRTRNITLKRSQRIRLPRSLPQGAVDVTVAVPAFTYNGIPYRAARAKRRYR